MKPVMKPATIAEAKAALGTYVTEHVATADERAEISRRVAAFVAAVVREERRKAREDKDRAIRALQAAVRVRDALKPFGPMFG